MTLLVVYCLALILTNSFQSLMLENLKNFTKTNITINLKASPLPKLSTYVGIGYDIFRGNPKEEDTNDKGFRSQIFEFTFNKNVLTNDGLYKIPDSSIVVNRQSCLFLKTSTQYSSTIDYQKDSVVVNGGFNSLALQASFSASTKYTSMQNTLEKDDSVVIESGARCEVYEASFPFLDNIGLTNNFKNYIDNAYKNLNDITWRKVIENWYTFYC